MALESVHARWVDASGYLNPPQPRCGHVAVSIVSETWDQTFLVVHGGIDRGKEALDDLCVLQLEQEAWFQPEAAAVGPAARAFHAAAAIGRRVYIFGGHVFVKQSHKLHQYCDTWCLDTDSWEWSRVDVHPDAPQPCARDRAAMAALGPTRLLVYGGADSLNRRLDDAWVLDLEAGTWTEVRAAGPRPRARCCATLSTLPHRVLLFGGDLFGATNELWSLRGADGEALPQWTQLSLEGPQPAPRRGHGAAVVGDWVVYFGGLTEHKSMLGMKSSSNFLADVVILDRGSDKVVWRAVDVADCEPAPTPREKHTLTAVGPGRLFLFGGTDGQTTLGDAWWLDLEDQGQGQGTGAQPGLPGISSEADTLASPHAAGSAGALSYLSSLPGVLSAPAHFSSAFSSLRGRLQGAGGTASAPGTPSAAPAAAGAARAAQLAVSAGAQRSDQPDRRYSVPGGSAEQFAEQYRQYQRRYGLPGAQDSGLLALGRRALPAGAQWQPSDDALVDAARSFLQQCSPEELQIGSLYVLMDDYRRLARVGWAVALQAHGPEALMDPGLRLPGRFMHLSAGELRVKDVGEVLQDYRALCLLHREAEAARQQGGAQLSAEQPGAAGRAEEAAAAEAPAPQPPPGGEGQQQGAGEEPGATAAAATEVGASDGAGAPQESLI